MGVVQGGGGNEDGGGVWDHLSTLGITYSIYIIHNYIVSNDLLLCYFKGS